MRAVPLLAVLALAALQPAPASAQIDLRVRADPMGDDARNLNGEHALISNEATLPLDLSGWRLCNAIFACFVLPDWADYATLRDPTGTLRASCYWDRGRGIDCFAALISGL